jgi:hypothetical protein
VYEAGGTRVEGNFFIIPFEEMGDIDEYIRRYFQYRSHKNNEI